MKSVVIAPFSNSAIRDWPLARYRELVQLLVQDEDVDVMLVGTASQWVAANEVVRDLPVARVTNTCGYIAWSQVLERIGRADCVIANNSGLAHIAAGMGRETLCVFGASHSPYEWMPRGPAVRIVTKRVECSPCGLDSEGACPYGVRCLAEIDALQVHAQCRVILQHAGSSAGVAA